MTRPAAHNALSEAVREAMDSVDPSRGQRTAFDLARALQGVIARFGLKSGFPECRDVVRDFAEENGLDPEDFESEVFLVWDSIACPEGLDPVTSAAQLQDQGGIPEGFLKSVPAKARAQCWQTLCIARRLSANGDRRFYLSARKLGEALNISPMTACRMLNLLCSAGHLQKVGRPTTKQAQYFQLKNGT